jgi:hypothetical protein
LNRNRAKREGASAADASWDKLQQGTQAVDDLSRASKGCSRPPVGLRRRAQRQQKGIGTGTGAAVALGNTTMRREGWGHIGSENSRAAREGGRCSSPADEALDRRPLDVEGEE